jgi:ATP-dependent protease Clp ATPase subunit
MPEARRRIASPSGEDPRKYRGPQVYVCDECLGLCNEIMHEQRHSD